MFTHLTTGKFTLFTSQSEINDIPWYFQPGYRFSAQVHSAQASSVSDLELFSNELANDPRELHLLFVRNCSRIDEDIRGRNSHPRQT